MPMTADDLEHLTAAVVLAGLLANGDYTEDECVQDAIRLTRRLNVALAASRNEQRADDQPG